MGDEPQTLEYAHPPPRRRRTHRVTALLVAHLVASYAAGFAGVAATRFVAPDVLSPRSLDDALGMVVGSPIVIPLVPLFSLWDGFGAPFFVPTLVCAVAYFVLLALTYYLLWRFV